MSTRACLYSLSTVPWKLLAEDTRRPSTRATSVAINPVASLITSVESRLRWCCGSRRRKAMPTNDPATGHRKARAKIAREFIDTPAHESRRRSQCYLVPRYHAGHCTRAGDTVAVPEKAET